MDSVEDDNVDNNWVKLKFQNQEEHEDPAGINDLDERFKPTRIRVRAGGYETAFTRHVGNLCAELAASEEEMTETRIESNVTTTWRAVSMEAVMFVPEVPEETNASVYHTPHGFEVKQ
jgi:hypothetical protein